MTTRIEKAASGGTIRAIASKSHAHRLLICAALSGGETFISCPEISEDIIATADCLTSLGAELRRERGGYYVNSAPIRSHTSAEHQKAIIIDCGESGSTFRFLLPVVCALGIPAEFVLRGRLSARPISPLADELCRHGCAVTGVGTDKVRVSGKLQNGVFTLPGDISSQFISGLLLALPIIGGGRVCVTGKTESRPYIDMTVEALNTYGVKIQSGDDYYAVDSTQRYSESVEYAAVEGDWSGAAFWLCLGALGGSVTCTGLNMNSKQGDIAIVRILREFGAEVECSESSVTVRPGRLLPINLDAKDTPDLVPVLAAVASVAEGKSVFRGAARLRIKESDRLQTVAETLNALGGGVCVTEDGLIITGKQTLDGGTISSHGDHRIAMTAAVASVMCRNPVTILGAEAVAKSYPGFFEDFCALGGEISNAFPEQVFSN